MTVRRTVPSDAPPAAVPVGLAVVDREGRVTLMNAAFHDLLGLEPGRPPLGSNIEDVVRASLLRGTPGSADPDAEVRALLAGGRTGPNRLQRRSTAGRALELQATPQPDDDGHIITAVDVSGSANARVDAEAALAKVTTAVDTLRIGLAIFDARGAMLLSNPCFAVLLALPPPGLQAGVSYDHVLHQMETQGAYRGQEGAAFIAALRDVRHGKPRTLLRHRGNGRLINVMYDSLPGGGWTVTISDITRLAEAEDEARQRATMLDSVLAAVPHGICVYGPDRRVTMFNQTYLKVMDGAPVQLGEHLSAVIRRRAEAGEYGEGQAAEVFAHQVGFDISRPQTRRRVRANGTAIDIRTVPLPDGGHISVVTDISALVEAEAEARHRAQEMGVMLGSIRHGIVLWNAKKQLVACNLMASQMFDLPPGLMIAGRNEAEFVDALLQRGHLGRGEQAVAEAQAMLAHDPALFAEREVRTASGRVLTIQSNSALGGGWVSTVVDVTKTQAGESELRQAKEVAEAANKAKSRFLATMSHELRTPLNAIIGFSDALLRDTALFTIPDIAEYGNQINAAGKQLLTLINTILDVARIETGRFDSDNEWVDVAKVLRQAVRQVESSALAAELSLLVKVPDDLPHLRTDERQLLQVLSQLLSNAIKFTEAGGSITVAAGLAASGSLWLRVSDTGIGIAEGELERVFEPFTQLDDTLARRYAGTGVGLYIARAIVTTQGGQISLSSKPGLGTVAEVVMPKRRVAH